MSRIASLIFGKPDVPLEIGSTIPRQVRTGPPPAAQQVATHMQGIETRSSDRFVPRKSRTWLTLAGGKKLDARIINMSSRSVAVEADFSDTKADAVVMVGSQPVRPGRKIALGAVFVFLRPLDRTMCNQDIVI